MEDKQLRLVEVHGVVRDPRGTPVVLLKADSDDEVLPIWIGHAEGVAIELHLRGESFERPLTHDLLKTTLQSLGASVARVVITELRGSTFFARIYVERGSDVHVIDARPSDSIALALKCRAPLFVASDVYDGNKRSVERAAPDQGGSQEDLRRYLKDLDPGDF